MKLGTIISALALSISMAVGVGVAVSTSVSSNEAIPVTAYHGQPRKRIYVDITNAPNSFNGSVYCHNWQNDGGTDYNATGWPGTKMTQVGSSKLYYCDLNKLSFNDNYNEYCIFNNGSGTQTGNLSVVGGLFNLNSAGTDGTWTSNVDKHYTSAHQTPSSNTMRLFVNNSNVSNWNSEGAVTAIRCWGSSSFESPYEGATYDLQWFGNEESGASGKWYGYADVPTDISGWAICRCSGSGWGYVWNEGPKQESVAASSAARLYILKEYNWDFSLDSTTSDSAVGPSMACKILEAYDTCSSSNLNGYGAYSALYSNFFSHLTSSAETQPCTSLNGKSMAVSAHVNGMAERSGNALPFSAWIIPNNIESTSITLAVVISVAAMAMISGFFLIKKKRKEN